MRFSALWIPGLLVLIVLTVHAMLPDWSILAIIAFSAPLLTILILIAQQGFEAWLPLKGAHRAGWPARSTNWHCSWRRACWRRG